GFAVFERNQLERVFGLSRRFGGEVDAVLLFVNPHKLELDRLAIFHRLPGAEHHSAFGRGPALFADAASALAFPTSGQPSEVFEFEFLFLRAGTNGNEQRQANQHQRKFFHRFTRISFARSLPLPVLYRSPNATRSLSLMACCTGPTIT